MTQDKKRQPVGRYLSVALVAGYLALAPLPAQAACEMSTMITQGAKNLDQVQKNGVEGLVTYMKGAIDTQLNSANTFMNAPLVGYIDLQYGHRLRQRFTKWWKTWLDEGIRPMTKQLYSIKVDQARNLGTAIDAESIVKTQRDMQVREAEAVKKFMPGEFTCNADSTARYMNQAQAASKGAQAALVTDISRMGMNVRGSGVEGGPASWVNRRWDIYSKTFCNNASNSGAGGCATALPDADADTAVARTLFRKETIDMSNPNNVLAAREMVQNISSTRPAEIVPPAAFNSAPGRENFLRQRRLQAQTNAVTAAVSGVVGDRVPAAGGVATEVVAQRLASGVPASEISNTPSKRELRQTVIDRLWSPQFYRDLGDEPNTVLQKEVYLKAYSNALMYDLIARTEQIAMLLAVQLGDMTDKAYPAATGGNVLPVAP